MRVGFVVLAHDDPATLDQLLVRLAPAPVALHVDRPALRRGMLRDVELGGHVVVNPEPKCVHWGGFSAVEAMLESLDLLLLSNSKVEYVAFLSGHCFPLRPVSEFERFLLDAPYAVHCRGARLLPDQASDMSADRVQRRHWFDGPIGHGKKTRLAPAASLLRRGVVAVTAHSKVRLPHGVEPVVGSQWSAMPVELAHELIAEYRAGASITCEILSPRMRWRSRPTFMEARAGRVRLNVAA
ncbi:beta-1,6-N-acetylglucosaminyltransferase [Nocardioides ungokensis]|uniref:beta-1,6-N-acetylglucosaminyltransferase n=1 Tax=Nocardioides ungokensis TaxID=1643322 RepID=UPI0015DE637F